MSYIEDARALERELRDSLRGRRVVLEIGVDAALHERVTRVLEPVVRYMSASVVVRTFPALVVTYLTGHAIYHYSGGLWDKIDIDGIDNTWGPRFKRATEMLELETFDELVANEVAHPWVPRIVAHGGIPSYCVGDLFQLIFHDIKYVDTATDMLARWRSRSSTFVGIDVPVQRFFLYGGELAVDFLDRCLDLLRHEVLTGEIAEPAAVGLPPYVVVAYRNLERTEGKSRASTARSAAPVARPRIELDAWSSEGPVAVLPPVAGGGVWTIDADGHERVPTSTRDEQRIALRPAVRWEIALHSDGALREWTFVGTGAANLVCFEPLTGGLIPGNGGVRGRDIIVVFPRASKVQVSTIADKERGAAVIEDLPPMLGDWSTWRAKRVDLAGTVAFWAESGTAGAARLPVRPVVGVPEIVDPPVESVTTAAGLPLYARCPSVALPVRSDPSRWSVRVTTDVSNPVSCPASDVIDAAGVLEIGRLVPDRATVVSIVVRGPLGSPLRAEFGLVPGLRVAVPQGVLLPGDESVVRFECNQGGFGDSVEQALRVAVPSDSPAVATTWQLGERTVLLIATAPRLVWSVVRERPEPLGVAEAVLSVDEILDGTARAVSIAAGRQLENSSLELWCGDTQLIADPHPTLPNGRWTFALDRFADALRMSEDTEFSLRLRVGVRVVPLARVRASLRIENLRVHARIVDEFTGVDLEFEEGRPLRHRVVRLWSHGRPWERFIQEAIPDEARGRASIGRYGEIWPGRYTAELAIDDGWAATPTRRPTGANSTTIDIGSQQEVAQYLHHLDLDDPYCVLEVAVTSGDLERELGGFDASRVAGDALTSLIALLADDRALPRQIDAVAEILTAAPIALADGIAEVAGSGALTLTDLAQIQALCAGRLGRPQSMVSDATMRALWACAPALAAALDFADSAVDSCDRSIAVSGWHPSLGVQALHQTEEPPQALFFDRDADQLEGIIVLTGLLVDTPSAWLEQEAYVRTCFEWLRADRRGDIDAMDLWRRGRFTTRDAPGGSRAAQRVSARLTSQLQCEQASLGAASLAAALHCVARNAEALESQRFLVDLARHCPRLVVRDLVLAQALLIAEDSP